jgi:hypothetical protein
MSKINQSPTWLDKLAEDTMKSASDKRADRRNRIANAADWSEKEVKDFMKDEVNDSIHDKALKAVIMDALFSLGTIKWKELAKSIAREMPKENN